MVGVEAPQRRGQAFIHRAESKACPFLPAAAGTVCRTMEEIRKGQGNEVHKEKQRVSELAAFFYWAGAGA